MRRRGWFRILALLGVPLFLLLSTELLLRLGGFGYPTRFFLRRVIDQQTVETDNQDFGRRFFPPALLRYPHPFTLPAKKSPGELRVFVLGESAALGDPEPKFGLPRMLEILLQERYPDRRVQVLNAAMVAISSHAIVPIARDCAKRESDLWVLYLGNNEAIGPFGALSPFGAQVPPRPLIRASLALKETRIGQLLDRALRFVPIGPRGPSTWEGMTMWGDQQVRHTDPRIARVRDNFRRNLEEIVQIGRAAGVPIVLCTVATNLKDCAPFGSLHSPALAANQMAEWNAAAQAGAAAESRGDFAEARRSYRQALALDDAFAETWYRAARCASQLGEAKTAAQWFREARDRDTLQFRADGAINRIIRDCAASSKSGVVLLDAEELFASKSGGVPGLESFYEHVHFTPAGNYLLSRAVAEVAVPILSGISETPAQRLPATATSHNDWLSQGACLERLGFTDWNRHDILSRILTERVEQPPFTHQANHEQHVAALRAELDQCRAAAKPTQVKRAARQVADAVARRPKDADLRWNLAQLLEIDADVARAAEQWQEVTRLWPQAGLPYYNWAKLLHDHRRPAEARPLYEASLRLNPDYFLARYSLGVLLSEQGEFDAAIPHLRLAVQKQPSSVNAHLALAQAWQRTRHPREAQQSYQEVLRLEPGNAVARKAIQAVP